MTNFVRLRGRETEVVIIHGVEKKTNVTGWSFDTRDAADVPGENWHEFNWAQRTDLLMKKARVPAWKRFAWRRGVDATAWHAISHDVIRTMRDNLRGMIGSPICLIGHSWGGVVLVDLLRSLVLDPINGIHISQVITVSCPGWNVDHSSIPFPKILDGWCNIRNWLDPFSGSLDHIVDPARDCTMEDICVWGKPWWRIHTGTMLSDELIDLIKGAQGNGA